MEDSIRDMILKGGDGLTPEFKPYEQLHEENVRDALTGVYNRGYFINELKNIPFDEDITIVMIDIDKFKKFNDTHGHPVGDKVLINTANILNDNVHLVGNGVRDIVARYGGEEFVLLFRHFTNKADVKEKIEKIRKLVESNPIRYDGKELKVTISSGIANRKEGENMDNLVKRADKALYKAKKAGRNRVVVSKSV